MTSNFETRNNVGDNFYTYTSRYIHDLYITKYEENYRALLITVRSHPSDRIKLALRARRVDAELGPGGRGKDLVGKGLGTVRARLATVRARPDTVRARPATAR